MSRFGPSDQPSKRRRSKTRSRVGAASSASEFVLYVEGPRDHDILRIWARRLSPNLARSLDPCAVILGGRQPARAREHFRGLGGEAAGLRGLVVLDRDHHRDADHVIEGEPGLEFFTWSRRHIESYVLVPDAIRRFVGREQDAAPRADRLIVDHVPAPSDEAAHRGLDAKRLLGNKGPFARAMGSPLSPAGIARCMRAEELHPDVIDLYDRIRDGLGMRERHCEVVRRDPTFS